MVTAKPQARYPAAVVATRKAFDAYRNAKTEPILICNGERDGSRSLAWDNEERARDV